MHLTELTHAWSGPMSALIHTPKAEILDHLRRFLPDATGTQQRAWDGEVQILQSPVLHLVGDT